MFQNSLTLNYANFFANQKQYAERLAADFNLDLTNRFFKNNKRCIYFALVFKVDADDQKILGEEQVRAQQTYKYLFAFHPTDILRSLDVRKFSQQEARAYARFFRNYKELFTTEYLTFFESSTRDLIILERQYFVEKPDNPSDNNWGNILKWHNMPLHGTKPTAVIYFTWLRSYTHLLMPLSVICLICFVYGAVMMSLKCGPVSDEICPPHNTTLMCPLCDSECDFCDLESTSTCPETKPNYLLNNGISVICALLMSLWSVLYFKFCKSYYAGQIHHWSLTDVSPSVDHPRPKLRAYKKLAAVKTANNVLDPGVSFWNFHFWCILKNYTFLLTFICISLIIFGSLVIYRMPLKASSSLSSEAQPVAYKRLAIGINILFAAISDVIAMSLLDYLYTPLAVYLTNFEYCRTQTEYDEGLTIKNFMFRFVNNLSTLFYVVFFKGKFVGYAGDYNGMFDYRQEECHTTGCATELCAQLVAIVFGRELKRNIRGVMQRYLHKFKRTYNPALAMQDHVDKFKQWTEGIQLGAWTNTTLLEEYLEMVIQRGFVTLFGIAFPLAPLLALINIIIEKRFDARKMLIYYRRPAAQHANNTGVWYKFIHIITGLTVLSNAIIIAFSTSFIPKYVYGQQSGEKQRKGYVNISSAYFEVNDFQVKPKFNNGAI